MDRETLKQHFQGAIATPVPTPFDDDFRVDFGRMAELTQWLVESGLVAGKAVIKAAAAMGEGPQLRDDEWPGLLRTTVQAAQGRAPVVCGIHYKDTLRTIEDAKKAQDLGAVGLQISAPVFNIPTEDDILRYYSDVSDAIDVGILVYPTHMASAAEISEETIRKMVDFEHVVAIKWSPPAGREYDDLFDLAGVFNIIDNSLQPVRCHKQGGRGFINRTIEAYPPHDLRVWDLMEDGRYDEAQTLFDSVNAPLADFYAKISLKSGGQARMKKGMMALMGRPVGDSRPPSLSLSADELAELRELMVGFGWPVAE